MRGALFVVVVGGIVNIVLESVRERGQRESRNWGREERGRGRRRALGVGCSRARGGVLEGGTEGRGEGDIVRAVRGSDGAGHGARSIGLMGRG